MKQVDLATIIKRLNAFSFPDVDLVVGLETGGAVPAALVACRIRRPAVFMSINYRDVKNNPQHAKPVFLKPFRLPAGVKKILIVDDVAVSGQTLALAREKLKAFRVTTFVLKGKADHVLFPRIKECVHWPWKS